MDTFFGALPNAISLLITGCLVLLLYRSEQRARRQLQQQELDLQNRRFDSEQADREAKRKWREEQALSLRETARPLTEAIATQLRENCAWAAEALERAKLGPYSETLFGDRKNHFRDEKELLGERFAPLLLRRCKHLVETHNKRLFLLIDSGTTLFPLFKLLGLQSVRARESQEGWIDRVTVVTNNLPGVEALMEVGRPNPANRYSGLALQCRLLPGVPLPIYSAVTGPETQKALTDLREREQGPGDAVFLSIVTGNWIRIRKSQPRCPVPMARGEGHLPFKQTLVDAADETYVLSPLGKVFANVSREEVNKALGYSSTSKDAELKEYEELAIANNASSVKLVSTSRQNKRLLQNLSRYLRGQLSIAEHVDEESFALAPIGQTPHVLFPFDNLPQERAYEREVEFPHKHTRRDDFMRLFLDP